MSADIRLDDLLGCAVAAARASGDHALANAHLRGRIVQSTKHDVKLQLDVECQAKAETAIRERFPDHSILGEESPASAERLERISDFCWIIDPIDGTVNFFHGMPHWCCSVAVYRRGEAAAGAVYAPESEEIYTATADRPAHCNGAPIQVSATPKLSESLVLTGLDKNAGPGLAPFGLFERIASNTQKARVMGSAALDICQVARGGADGYFESGIYIWDIAAAGLIVRQAGGRAEILAELDRNRLCFLATNGLIHADLRRVTDSGAEIISS